MAKQNNNNSAEAKLKARAIAAELPEDATIQAIEEAEDNVANPTAKDEFINPFQKGTSYADFLNALGEKSIAEYCGPYLTPAQISWLEREIEHYKNK